MQWLPIESAPVDGTNVLLYFDGCVIEGYMCDVFEKWRAISLEQHGCGCCADDDVPPTHWMPLPEPPSV